jgi:hypothetical protein
MDFIANNRLNVVHAETGGTINRTVHLELGTGIANLISPAGKSQVPLG